MIRITDNIYIKNSNQPESHPNCFRLSSFNISPTVYCNIFIPQESIDHVRSQKFKNYVKIVSKDKDIYIFCLCDNIIEYLKDINSQNYIVIINHKSRDYIYSN